MNWYVYLAMIPLFALVFIFIYHKFFIGIIEKCNKFILIGIILIFTIIPRLLWINMVSVVPKNDFQLYYNIATALSQGKSFGKMYVALFPHTFGYPFVLSLFFRIFGPKIIVAQYLNICLCCGIAVILFALGRMLNTKSTGFLAAMIWAFCPSQIFYTVLLSSEALFTFLMLSSILFFYAIVKYTRKNHMNLIFFMFFGMLLALLNAIRPFGMVLILASIIFFLLSDSKNTDLKKTVLSKIISCTILIISYLLIFNLVSYAISSYNKVEVAKSPLGFNTYVGSNYKYNGIWNVEDSSTLNDLINSGKYSAQNIHDILLQMAVERFNDNSYRNIKLLVEKHMVMWVTDNDNINYIKGALDSENSKIDYLKYKRFINKISNFYYYLILFACGLYMIISLFYKTKDNNYIYLAIIISGIIATHMIVEVAGRYHYPAISILSLLGALGIHYAGVRNSLTPLIRLKAKSNF